MTHVTLVRHGQSVSNAAGRWQGQGPSALSDRGRAQARAVARRLAEVPFDRIVSSDLDRALDTARALGRPVEADPAWRELDLGAWEGLTSDEVATRWPDEVEALRRGEDVPVGGGESCWALGVRVVAAWSRLLASSKPDERVLVVAHGGVIITLVSALLGVAERRPRPLGKLFNTCVSELAVIEGRPRLLRYNDASHLAGAQDWANERSEGYEVVGITGRDAVATAEDVLAGGVGSGLLGPLDAGSRGVLLRRDDRRVLAAWNVPG